MDMFLPVAFFCFGPILLFAAGWAACYYLMVKYRLRFDRREDYDLPASASNRRRVGNKPAWEP